MPPERCLPVPARLPRAGLAALARGAAADRARGADARPGTGALQRAFELVDLGRQLRNSVFVALIAVPLTVLVASWAGFAATRLGARGRRLIVGASLVGLLVPLSALWVPRFVLFSELSLIDTYVPLVAPALMAPAAHRRLRA